MPARSILEDYEFNGTLNAFTDRHTGEIIDALPVPSGSIVFTPEEQRRHKEWQENKASKKLSRLSKSELGYFFFAHENCVDDIKPQTLTRLLFVATYLGYGDNRLRLSERTLLKKADLIGLLRLKNNTFYGFWGEVSGKYITENDDGSLSMSDMFCRGVLDKKTRKPNNHSYQQFYIETLRELYLQSSTAQHRYLGYIFELIPYVNWEFNILCWNPSEKTLSEIIPMTFDDLCAEIGYCKSQRARLLDACRNLSFEYDGRTHKLVSFVSDGSNHNVKIFINPRIVYKGHNWQKVEILGVF